MRHVRFDPSELQGEHKDKWDAWVLRAEAARQAALDSAAAGETVSFNNAIWSSLKEDLISGVFNGFCAYCESPLRTTGFGDAEHYRPKGKVQVLVGNRRQTVRLNGKQHPGYYWLAYDWRNLVPACSQCNTKGKGNLFPVAGIHVDAPPAPGAPSDLDELEQPLLLHPYIDQPSRHLTFGVRGSVGPADDDPRGAASIQVYKLDREELMSARDAARALARHEFVHALGEEDIAVARQRVEAVISKLKEGRVPYSAAALAAVRDRIALTEGE